MKSLIINTKDIQSGSARAAHRLHCGLIEAGINSQMLVQQKSSDESAVLPPKTKLQKAIAKLKPTLDALPLSLYSQRERTPYSVQWFPDSVTSRIKQIDPDIVNLHWINWGFVQIETLAKLNKPLVWTLHDMWAFTGGCHYNRECDRYNSSCGACPQLQSNKEKDLSRWIWQRKAKAWQNLNLTIVTPSHWLAECARASSLFRDYPIKVIPNGIDIQRYKPLDRPLVKELLGLPPNKQLILFGAVSATSDTRKGFHLLIPALQKLGHSALRERVELVVFGSSQPKDTPDFGLNVRYLGRLNDDISLALLYAAADIFIAPSIQDNLPNTIMEALACGTPCVAFDVGGIPDMIEHQKNGYLARPFEVEDLTRGILWLLENGDRYSQLANRARQKVEQEFTVRIQSQKYLNLYQQMLSDSK